MATGTLSTAFDYGFLPAADGKALERRAENIDKINERGRKVLAELAIKLGEELVAAKAMLANHGDGCFKRWSKDRCKIGESSVKRAVRAFETFKDRAKLAPSFEVSAVYALSADTCPEAAFDKAIEEAESGKIVTHKRAKEIIAEFTPEEAEDEDEDDSPVGWSLHDALEHLNAALEEIEAKWPSEFRETLGHKLIQVGECILELAAPGKEDAA